MKFLNNTFLAVILVASQAVSAGEIVSETADNTVGAAYGGGVGLLVGGAATGGPLGALVGLGLGILGGKFAQQKAGLSQRAYVVSADGGNLKTVRSPRQIFQPGDQVTISGNRLH